MSMNGRSTFVSVLLLSLAAQTCRADESYMPSPDAISPHRLVREQSSLPNVDDAEENEIKVEDKEDGEEGRWCGTCGDPGTPTFSVEKVPYFPFLPSLTGLGEKLSLLGNWAVLGIAIPVLVLQIITLGLIGYLLKIEKSGDYDETGTDAGYYTAYPVQGYNSDSYSSYRSLVPSHGDLNWALEKLSSALDVYKEYSNNTI
ncbi:uncharacterized protein LOC108675918 [Hyalella azteca]|uniref:Uncharacterized protein LOC108675918 n=1 Tax=Hyalella azteca TaxID=294128 RepID=A0A8B7P0H5_HYAAZ|nr:uncharacterized protein LOC108675918 [Hyalella azteca]